ncbi:XRE family transcriptional regulator [Gordonia sp. CPCC 205515]|uniref:helix-turn-helix domain-containing protein n=1 Tax=Gordonia sp. CPCC 205515 TaxID=3140791 RepID=UPI003AF3BF9D
MTIDEVSEANQLVARNIRRFRVERGYSLGELARRSGLAKQTVSKIEQGTGNPTVETLILICAALDVSARRVLTEWGTPVYVQRAGDSVWSSTGPSAERLLDEVYGTGYVRNLLVRFERDGTDDAVIEAHSPGTLHHVFVSEGRLELGPVGDLVVAFAGDFVRYPADVPHQCLCVSDRAVAHIVTTRPQLQQFDAT